MSKPLILVAGATGKTGAPATIQLLDLGYPVRALVHRSDERSDALAKRGAEIVVGDFLEIEAVRKAFTGVKRAYFCHPPADRLVEATANIAIAASDEGIEALVNMSQVTAREIAKSPLAFQHWQAEQILDWADIGASHIRPTFFAEDLYLFSGSSIAAEGKIKLPFGDERHSPVAAEDIARVVVGILSNPSCHVGERYVVTGARNMTLAEMADVLSHELGKTVEYQNVPIDSWGQELLGQAGFPPFLATHLTAVAKDHRDGIFSAQTAIVEQIGGRRPQSLAEFVRANRLAFTGNTELATAAREKPRASLSESGISSIS